jgi:hypothetical protein
MDSPRSFPQMQVGLQYGLSNTTFRRLHYRAFGHCRTSFPCFIETTLLQTRLLWSRSTFMVCEHHVVRDMEISLNTKHIVNLALGMT